MQINSGTRGFKGFHALGQQSGNDAGEHVAASRRSHTAVAALIDVAAALRICGHGRRSLAQKNRMQPGRPLLAEGNRIGKHLLHTFLRQPGKLAGMGRQDERPPPVFSLAAQRFQKRPVHRQQVDAVRVQNQRLLRLRQNQPYQLPGFCSRSQSRTCGDHIRPARRLPQCGNYRLSRFITIMPIKGQHGFRNCGLQDNPVFLSGKHADHARS